MNKNRIFFILLALLVGLTIFFRLAIYPKLPENLFCYRDIGTHRLPNDFIELNRDTIIGQSFVPNFDHLFKLSIFISKAGTAAEGATVRFHLRPRHSQQDIYFREWKPSDLRPSRDNFYQIPPDHIRGGDFHFHIQFPIIKDAKNKEFYFYLDSPEAAAGKGIRLGVWESKYYEALSKGKMHKNHQPIDGRFLAFRTYHTWQGSLSQVFSEIKARLLMDKGFLVFYLLLISAVCLLIFLIQLKMRKYKGS